MADVLTRPLHPLWEEEESMLYPLGLLYRADDWEDDEDEDEWEDDDDDDWDDDDWDDDDDDDWDDDDWDDDEEELSLHSRRSRAPLWN